MGRRLALLCLAAAALGTGARPADAQPLETAVKAAFLPKFAAYVGWPAAALPHGAPFTICIVGRDPYGKLIDDATAGQSVGGRPIAVRRLQVATRPSLCQLAFVGGSPRQSVAEAMAALDGAPVLTVTDKRNGDARGMIHFELKDGRVRFHADEAQAARGNLSISSRLLGLALSVRPRPRV